MLSPGGTVFAATSDAPARIENVAYKFQPGIKHDEGEGYNGEIELLCIQMAAPLTVDGVTIAILNGASGTVQNDNGLTLLG